MLKQIPILLTRAESTELIRTRVVELKHENPTRTLQSLGDEVGVTRERVRQILKSEGLTDKYPPREYQSKRAQLHDSCKSCGVHLMINDYPSRKRSECVPCRTESKDKMLNTYITCLNCSTEFKISKAYLATRQRIVSAYHRERGKGHTSDRPFCSRQCAAGYHKLGKAYGFGSPEHAHNRANGATSKSLIIKS